MHPDILVVRDINVAQIVAEQLHELRLKPVKVVFPYHRKGILKDAISTRGGRKIAFLDARTKTPFGNAWGVESDYGFGPNEFTNFPIMYFQSSDLLRVLPRKYNTFTGERIEFDEKVKNAVGKLEDRIGKPHNWWNFGGDRTAHICVQDEVREIFTGIRNQLGNKRIISEYRSNKAA